MTSYLKDLKVPPTLKYCKASNQRHSEILLCIHIAELMIVY